MNQKDGTEKVTRTKATEGWNFGLITFATIKVCLSASESSGETLKCRILGPSSNSFRSDAESAF